MQRLARTVFSEPNQKAIDLFNQFTDIKRQLIRHLPPSTLQLFAEPVVKGDVVEWYSDLEGQPVKVEEKKLDRQIQQKIQHKIDSIRQFIAEQQAKNALSAEKAQQIENLLSAANYSQKEIYLVNNEPVLVGWGMGNAPQPVSVAPVAVAAPSFFARHRWCCWLLPLLLLLLGLLAWWWFFMRQPDIVTPTPQPVVETVKKEEVEKNEVKPEPQPVPTPQEIEPAPPVVTPEPEPVVEMPEPVATPTPESKPVEPVKPEPVCTKTIKPAERPQMVIVFDNSISMLFSLKETQASIDNFFQRIDMGLATQSEFEYMTREPRRLTVAKSSTSTIIDKIDSHIDIGLITLNACPNANNAGFYTPNKRKTLKTKIRNMYPVRNPSIGGTPLYSGLKQAASLVDGVKRDAFVLLVSDGEDTCQQGDVCQLATELARRKPKLKINVVDIGNAKAANCVAKATGGKVFTANSKAQVSAMINQAIKPMEEKQECK